MPVPLPNSSVLLASQRQRKRQRRAQQRQLYSDWMERARPEFAGTANVFALGALIVGASINGILFEGDVLRRLTLGWLVSVVLLGVSYLVYRRSRRPAQVRLSAYLSILCPLLYLLGLFSYTLLYAIDAPASHHDHALMLAGLSAVLSCGLLYRLQREQLLFAGLGCAGYTVAATCLPDLRTDFLDLAGCLIAGAAATVFFRREFVSALFERYQAVRAILPAKMARYLAVNNGTEEALRLVFPAKPRFAVCISIGLSGQHKVTGELTPDEVARFYEVYYDQAYLILASTVPSGLYFADWSATDLFVIFYSEREDTKEVISEAMAFSKAFCKGASAAIERATGQAVTFDLGIAAGTGLLGLQGSPDCRKTTLSANCTQRARSLEQLARKRRDSRAKTPSTPLIMMEADLSARVTQLGIVPASANEIITVDGDGTICIAWQERELRGEVATQAAA